MTALAHDRHADDGALLRLLDRESEAHESWVAAHADHCAACAARLATLGAASALVREAFRRSDPVPARGVVVAPSRATRRARARWVGIGMLVAVGAAAASPLVRALRAPRAAPGAGLAATARADSGLVTGQDPRGLGVSWVVSAPEFVVRYSGVEGSRLVVVRTSGDEVHAIVASGVPFLALRDELRTGSATTRGTVRLEVPPAVRSVRVVGARGERVVRPPEQGDSVVVPLPE